MAKTLADADLYEMKGQSAYPELVDQCMIFRRVKRVSCSRKGRKRNGIHRYL